MRCPACGTTLNRARWKKGKATCVHCHRTWNVAKALKKAVRVQERAEGWTWWRRGLRWGLAAVVSVELRVRFFFKRQQILRAARKARNKKGD